MHRPPTIRESLPPGPRRCRRALIGAVLTVAAAITAASGAPAQTNTALPLPAAKNVRAPGCTLKGAKTIKADRAARVFKVTRRGFGNVYGCRRTARRAYVLGVVGECQNYDEVRLTELAGLRAALGIYECALTSGWWRVDLVDLRTGRREFSARPIAQPPAGDMSFDMLHRIVAASDGAVAWTATRRAPGGVRTGVEVRRRMRGSSHLSILLDSGTDIDPDSLRKRDRTLSWTKAGVRRTATF